MPDIFDQVAQEEAPAGDIFDEVAASMRKERTPDYSTPPPVGPPVPAPEEPPGFWRAGIERIKRTKATEPIPFVSGVVDAADAFTTYRAAKRYKQAEEQNTEPDPDDLEVLRKVYAENQRRAKLTGAGKIGDTVASILVQLPAFAGELFTTAGLYSAGRAAGQKAATKAISKFVEDAAEKSFTKYAGRIAGGIAGAAIQAPVAGAQRIAANTIERMTPEFGVAEDQSGKLRAVIGNAQDDFLPALAKAFGTQYVEVLSEHAGGLAGEALGKIPGVKALGKLKEKVIAKWFQTHPNSTIDDLVKTLKERGAWHGMINEMIEERLGEVGRIPIEGKYEPPDKEQLIAEAIGFSVPGAAEYGVRKTAGRFLTLKETRERAEKRAQLERATYAAKTREEAEAPGAEVAPGQGAGGGVRVRNAPEPGVAAPPGAPPNVPVLGLAEELAQLRAIQNPTPEQQARIQEIEAQDQGKLQREAWERQMRADLEKEKAKKQRPTTAAPPEEFTFPDGRTIRGVETRIDPKKLKLAPDVENFKEGAGKTGEVKPLTGPFVTAALGPIVVFERLNGELHIITGRHRWNHALRNKVKSVPVQIFKEGEGMTPEYARVFDAEANILDDKGEIRDYANYFYETRNLYDEASARARGLLGKVKGDAGWSIGRRTSDAVFTSWRNRQIGDAQAAAIGEAAPNNDAAQQVGLRAALQRASADEVRARIEAALAAQKAGNIPAAAQGDFFDNTELEDAWKKQAVYIAEKRKAIDETIASRRGVVNRYEAATSTGSITADLAKAKAEYDQAVNEKARWERWADFPDLRAEVLSLGKNKAEPVVPPAAKPKRGKGGKMKEEAAPAPSPAEVAKAEREAEINDLKDAIRAKLIELDNQDLLSGPRPINKELLSLVVDLAGKYTRAKFIDFVAVARDTFGKLYEKAKRYLPIAWADAMAANPGMEDISVREMNRIINAAPGAAGAAAPPSAADVSKFVALGPPQPKAHRSDPWVPFAPGTQQHADWTRLMEDVKAYVASATKKTKSLTNNAFKAPGLLAAFLVRNGVTRWEDLTRPMLEAYLTKQLFNLEAAKVLGAYQVGRPKRGKKQKQIRGPSKNTGKNFLFHLRTFLAKVESEIQGNDPTFFQKHQQVSTDPALLPKGSKGLRGAERMARKGYFTFAEMERMLAQPEPGASLAELQRHALFELLAFLGPRGTDVRAIKLKQLDLANNSIRHFIQKKLADKDTALKEVGRVMLPEVAVDALKRYLAKAGLTDPEARLFPFDTNDINKMIADFANAQKPPIRTVFGNVPTIKAFRASFAQYLRQPNAHPEGGALSDQDRLRITGHAGGAPILEEHYENPTSPEMKFEHLVKEGFFHAEAYRRKKHERVELEIPEGPVPEQHLKLDVKPEQIKPKFKAKESPPAEPSPADEGGLTPAQQREFLALSRIAKSARETGSRPLTGQELRRYQELEALAGGQNLPMESGKSLKPAEDLRLESERVVEEGKPGAQQQDLFGPSPTTANQPVGMTREEVEAEIAGENTYGFNVNIISHDDAKEMAKKGRWKSFRNTWGAFFHNGEIYLIHDRLRPTRAKKAIREEAGHGLLRTEAGQRLLMDLAKEFKLRLTDEEKQALRDNPAYKNFSDEKLLDEFIAKSVREDRTLWQNIREAVRAFLAKFGLVDLTNEEISRLILREIAAVHSKEARTVASDEPFPTASEEFEVPGLLTERPTGEDINVAQIKYAAAEIQRVVKDVIADRLAAKARLEKIVFDENRMAAFTSKREGKLQELVNAALRKIDQLRRAGQRWDEELPTKSDPELADKLERLQVYYNLDLDLVDKLQTEGEAGQIGAWATPQDMERRKAERQQAILAVQAEIRFERRASSLMQARQRRADMLKAQATLAKIGVTLPDGAPAVAEFNKTLDSLERRIQRAEADDDRNNELGMTISERATQLERQEAQRPDDQAKADSLNFEQVQDAFMGPKAFTDKTLERFIELGKSIQSFNELMDNPDPSPDTQNMQAAAAKELFQKLYEFDLHKVKFERFYDQQRVAIGKAIKTLTDKLSEDKITLGQAEIMVKDALATANGERGLTGNFQSAADAEILRQSYGAIMGFARGLRDNYPGGGAWAVVSRMLDNLSRVSEDFRERAAKELPQSSLRYFRSSESILNALRNDTSELDAVKNELEASKNEPGLDDEAKGRIQAQIDALVALQKQIKDDFDWLMKLSNVGDEILSKVISVLSRSRAVEDAVQTLLMYGEKGLETDPTARLREIEYLLDSPDLKKQIAGLEKQLEPLDDKGKPTLIKDLKQIQAINEKIEALRKSMLIRAAEARDRLKLMEDEARDSKDAAQASMRVVSRELGKQRIALQALEYAMELFDSVTHRTVENGGMEYGPPLPGETRQQVKWKPPKTEPNPDYVGILKRIDDALDVEWRPITTTGADPARLNGTSVFYHNFDLDVQLGNERVKIEQPLLIMPAEGSPLLNKTNFEKVRDYFNKAEDFVAVVEEMKTNGLDPAALGVDMRKYAGLKRMLAEQFGAHQDNTAISFVYKKAGNAVEQLLLFRRWFLQHLGVMKQVVGPAARNMQSAALRYFNDKKEAQAIGQEHGPKFAELRDNALKSHRDEYGGRKPTFEEYAKDIFNPMASAGRTFSGSEASKLKPGLFLADSGITITKEDIDFLDEVRLFLRHLRERVTERKGYGIIEERGTIKGGDYELLVRKAAGVGDKGVNMRRGKEAREFQKDIQAEYARAGEDLPGVDTDLGPNSTNPVVQFWNRDNGRLLRRHLMDAGRGFRPIKQTTLMVDAERKAAAAIEAAKNINMVQTVEDAVALITQNFKDGTQLDKRSEVVKSLFDELEQYRRLATATEPEMGPLQATESIGGLKLASEFTERAAQFIIPSSLYDYGVVTDSDFVFTQARAIHEQTLEYAKSLTRLKAALQAEIDATVKSTKNQTNYRSLNEAERVRDLIVRLEGEFNRSLNPSDPDVARQGFEFPPAVVKQSLLANPPVLERNIVLGLAMAFMRVAALDEFSRIFGMIRTLGNGLAMVARVPLHVVFSPTHALGRKVERFLEGPGRSLLPSAVDWFQDEIVASHLSRVNDVQKLGFSPRDNYLQALKNIWSRTNTFTTNQQLAHAGLATSLWRTMRNVYRSVGETYRLIGTEGADLIINAQWLAYAGTIEKMFKKIAVDYVSNRQHLRDSQGRVRFDAANPEFELKPNEFSKRLTLAGKQQNLLELRDFLVGTDIPLEKTLWDYGSKVLKGQPAVMFTTDQYKDLQRAVLRDMNASDAINRPTASTNSKLFRMLATFQGYPSDFLVKFIRQFAGSRDQTTAQTVIQSLPVIFAYAAAAAIIGLTSQVVTDETRRRLFGASKRMVNALDKEFWTDWGNFRDATTIGLLSTIPLIGDAVLYAKSLVVNNRGYEPTGRILAFGMINSFAAMVRGLWNLRTDPANLLNPIRDFILQYAGYGPVVSRAIGTDSSKVMQQRSGESILRFKAQQLGVAENNPATAAKAGLTYTPTSGFREDFTAAMVRRDPEGLQSAYKKIVGYYADKGIPEPEKSALRDVRATNPIMRAFGGKKPTQEEYDKVYSGLTAQQKETVNKAIENWNWAASQLGIEYDPISAGRGGGGAAAGPGFVLGGARGAGAGAGGSATAFTPAAASPRFASYAPSAGGGVGGGGLAGYGGGGGGGAITLRSPRRLSLRGYRTRGRTGRLRTRRLRLARRSLRTRRRSLRMRRRRLSLV